MSVSPLGEDTEEEQVQPIAARCQKCGKSCGKHRAWKEGVR